MFLRMAKEWYLISRKMNLRKGVRSWSDDANIKFADLHLSALPTFANLQLGQSSIRNHPHLHLSIIIITIIKRQLAAVKQ